MTEWTEPCGNERAKFAEVRGVRFCCLPLNWTYCAALGRHTCRVSHGLKAGKQTETGHEVDGMWFVNVYQTLPNGDSKNIMHKEFKITKGKEGEAKEAAFEMAAEQLLLVQRP